MVFVTEKIFSVVKTISLVVETTVSVTESLFFMAEKVFFLTGIMVSTSKKIFFASDDIFFGAKHDHQRYQTQLLFGKYAIG
jgi:hypothetical protein